MADKTPIASITNITGKAYVRDAQGNVREVFEGELLYQGEVLITSAGGSVDLATIDGEFVTVADATETTMTTDLVASLAAGTDESELTDESIDEITDLLAGDGDILEGLEATAAGVAGGGGDQEGHSFIRLGRIVEELNPLGLELPSDSRAIEEEDTTGLDEVPPEDTPEDTPEVLTIAALPNSASEEGLSGGLADTTGSPDNTDNSIASGQVAVTDSSGGPLVFSLTPPSVPVTSGGVPVVWAVDAAGTLTGTAGGTPVATITIDNSGNYEFNLLAPIDQPDGGVEDAQILDIGVTVINSAGASANTTLEISIEDDAPEAADDSYSVAESGSITIPAPGILGNDAAGADGPAGGTLTVSSFTNPTSGTLVQNADGSFTYTPTPGYVGGDSYTYTITDADGDTSTATVNLTVTDDPGPSVLPASNSVSEEGLAGGIADDLGSPDTTNLTAVSGQITASDAGGGALTFALSGPDGITAGNVPVVWTFDESTGVLTGTAGTTDVATVSIDSAGNYAFNLLAPIDQAAGTVEDAVDIEFGVTVTDSIGQTAESTLTISVEDDAPEAADDSYSVAESGSITIPAPGILGNDAAGADGPAGGTLTVSSFTNPTSGTLVQNADGSFTYTPTPGYVGGDSYTYTITDADGDTSTATVNLTVTDDPGPSVLPASNSVSEEGLAGGIADDLGSPDTTNLTAVSGQITASDAGGGALTFALSGPDGITAGNVPVVWTFDESTGVLTGTAGTTDVATVSIDSAGNYAFNLLAPIDQAAGTVEDAVDIEFGVTVTDSIGQTAESTLTISVEDDAPEAADDSYSVAESGSITIPAPGILGNDAAGADGPAGGTLTVSSFTNPTSGTLVQNADGSFTYTPTPGYVGGDSYTYTITDADGDTSTATVNLTVTDDPGPSVLPASNSVSEEGLAGGIADDLGSPDTTNLTAVSGQITASDAGGGALTFALSGPDGITAGNVPVVWTFDESTGVLTGTAGTTDVATVSIDSAGNYAFNLLAPIDQAAGTVEDAVDIEFGVTVTDSIGQTAESTLTISVEDDAPEAADDSYSVAESGSITIPAPGILGNDAAGADGPAGGTLTVSSFTNPTNGTLVQNADGSFTYTPTPGYVGDDSYTYTITDADGDTSTATVNLAVMDPPPVVQPANNSVSEEGLAGGIADDLGSPDTTNLTAVSGQITASDAGGGALTFALSGPDGITAGNVPVVWTFDESTGVLTGTAGTTDVATVSIDSAGNYAFNLLAPIDQAAGTVEDAVDIEFGVTVTDSIGQTAESTLTISVEDDAPDARDIFQTAPSEPPVHNIVLVLDRSVSMSYKVPNPDGSGGTLTKMEILKQQMTEFLNQYDEVATLNVQVYAFNIGVVESGWFNDDIAGVLDFINGPDMDPMSGTSYNNVLAEVADGFNPPAGADLTNLYFISDGYPANDYNPALGERDNPAAYEIDEAEWESFLATSGIETAYAAGIGVGVDADPNAPEANTIGTILNQVSWTAGEAPNDDETHDPDNLDNNFPTIYIGLTAGLSASLQSTVGVNPAEGSVLNTFVLQPGADGASITSVEFNGQTYLSEDGNLNNELTALGGAFTLDFTTGDYTYTPALSAIGNYETFKFNVTDGDSDTEVFSLKIGVGASTSDLTGTDAAEMLIGTAEADTLIGGGGDDVLVGGGGNDTLTGGLGADVFAWELGDQGSVGAPAIDTVTDFNAGEGDVLDLSDLLQTASPADLGAYIFIESDGVDSTVHISSTGALTGDASNADQSIIVEGVDLVAGEPDQNAIINDLISTGKLVTDV